MVRWKFFKKNISFPMIRLYRHVTARRVIWGAVFFIITALILGVNFNAEKIVLEEGQPSPRDFYAQQSVQFESQVLTEQARRDAANQVPPDYRVDKSVLDNLQAEVATKFAGLAELNRHYQTPAASPDAAEGQAPGDNAAPGDVAGETAPEGAAAEKQSVPVEEYQAVLGFVPEAEIYQALNNASPDELEEVANQINTLLSRQMRDGIQKEAIPSTKEILVKEAGRLLIAEQMLPVAVAVVEQLDLQANLVYDAQSTIEKKEEARRQVAPVVVNIRNKQKIMDKGDIVTAAHIEALQHLGMLRTNSPYTRFAGVLLLILVMYFLIGMYLFLHRRDVYEQDRYFNLLGLLIVTTLLIARTVTAISIGDSAELSVLVGYLVPVAAGSMLISVLLDNHLGIFATVVLSVFVGIINAGQMQFAVVALTGGLAGVFSVSHLSQRSDLVKASIYIVLANILTVISFGLINKISLAGLSVGSAMGVANGIFSSVLTIGMLPFLESAFRITTPVKLLELSNPNQPLLKRLLLEAPGTYHHAIMVGNLAEAAANAVGADGLLARVASYYHDIGKLKRPYFFIENQLSSHNPHDKLAPTLSTLIITSHVKDGVELAEKHGLPDVIRDIIEQHHGTGLISYFYHKACDECDAEAGQADVNSEDFRYETSKPQTKEAAIVMLADSVEAAVRAKQKLNPGKMEGFVRQVIKDKFDDGQLDECELTFKEMDVIAQAFVKILNGIFHSRVEYPDNVLKEMERGKTKNGNQSS